MNSKVLFVTLASGIFIGAALFDNFPEIKSVLGIAQALGYTALGIILWYALKKLAGLVSRSDFAIVSAIGFWLHSALEGAVVGVAFLAGAKIGLIVAVAMLLHLFPEFFAH